MKSIYHIACLLIIWLPINIVAQDRPQYVQILISPTSNSWNYSIGEDANIRITVLQNNIPQNNLKINYAYGKEGLGYEKEGNLIIENFYTNISIGTMSVPGFKTINVSAEIDGVKYSNSMTLGFSPHLITPTVILPTDFDSFWEQEKNKMRSYSSDYSLEVIEKYSTEITEVSLIHMKVPKSKINFYGYLSKPKKAGKYPAILYLPGAGISPLAPRINLVDKNIITLTIEIHGLNPNIDTKTYDEIRRSFNDYFYSRLESRDTYYYKHVLLGCIKAADFLSSLPDFDDNNLATFGGSQGGFLSLATAALHEKVSCVISYHPAMADITGYMFERVGGWPHIFKQKIYRNQQFITTLSYYDTVNFAKKITVPCFMSFGYNDATCPATTSYTVYNSIHSEKTLFATPITGHWRIPEMRLKTESWLKKQFKMH